MTAWINLHGSCKSRSVLVLLFATWHPLADDNPVHVCNIIQIKITWSHFSCFMHLSQAALPYQIREVDPMFFKCWAWVADGGPTLKQHWANALFFWDESRAHFLFCHAFLWCHLSRWCPLYKWKKLNITFCFGKLRFLKLEIHKDTNLHKFPKIFQKVCKLVLLNLYLLNVYIFKDTNLYQCSEIW